MFSSHMTLAYSFTSRKISPLRVHYRPLLNISGFYTFPQFVTKHYLHIIGTLSRVTAVVRWRGGDNFPISHRLPRRKISLRKSDEGGLFCPQSTYFPMATALIRGFTSKKHIAELRVECISRIIYLILFVTSFFLNVLLRR